MLQDDQTLEEIYKKLISVSRIKQKTYRTITEVFHQLSDVTESLAKDLAERVKKVDENVVVDFMKVSDFEFHLKFSGDMLVFMLQTNIITFGENHAVMTAPYVQEDRNRGYFGHIMMYNFLADSIKYNRLSDPGYLIARIMVNHEKHFFVEGVRQLDFLFTDLSANLVTSEWLNFILQKAVLSSIEIDLIAPNYPDIKYVTLNDKINNEEPMGRGEKIGFQMSLNSENK